jgi:hypothetical protein
MLLIESLLLTYLLRVVGATVWALHPEKVELHPALFQTVIAEDLCVNISKLLWHLLLGH